MKFRREFGGYLNKLFYSWAPMANYKFRLGQIINHHSSAISNLNILRLRGD
jgi:hypothetical protein